MSDRDVLPAQTLVLLAAHCSIDREGLKLRKKDGEDRAMRQATGGRQAVET